MTKYIDPDDWSDKLRSKVIDLKSKRLLISRITGSTQEKDASQINCQGYGRIRTLKTKPSLGWGKSCVRHRVAYQKLGIPPSEADRCQVYQIAACNYRCWYCYVDFALLVGDPRRSKWFSSKELLEYYLSLPQRPRIVALSGGQPDLTPEWAVWTLKEIDELGIEDQLFVWMDDNLSGDFTFKFLSDDEIELMRRPTFAKLCGVKGIDPQRFSENTNVLPLFFEMQLETLSKLIQRDIDVYIELTLTSADDSDIDRSISSFLDRLMIIHPNLPLRVNPTEIRPYTPTSGRIDPVRSKALENQYKFNDSWLEELTKRFSTKELTTPQSEISLM